MGIFNFWKKTPEPQMLPKLVFHQYPTDAAADPGDTDPPLNPTVGTIKHIKSPGLLYRTQEGFTRGTFRSPEYNLYDIGRLEDLDGYVARSFTKKIGLMFKEGWEITGHNKRYVRYVRRRLQQMSDASGLSTNQLLRAAGSSLIKKSNTVLVKVRNTEASGGAERTAPGSAKTLKPIAALFPLPAESLRVDVDKNGKVYKWKQEMEHGDKEFSPDDIFHFYHDRKDGFVFGTPTVLPVIDDVLALRKIEENVEVLIHQFLFPLFQYIVGTEDKPATQLSDGTDEITYVEQRIALMPTEGGIVTPERHEIKVLGAGGHALRAEQYLIYFKQRVFAGLGISSVDMGEAGAANRATADSLSIALIDGVKDFQRVFEDFFNEQVIRELMLESSFDKSTLFDDENLVKLRFREIDLDNQIKRETHAGDLFAKQGIDFDEYRERLSLESIEIPNRTDIQEMDPEELDQQFPQFYRLHWKLFGEPLALITATDEPFSAEGIAAAKNPSTDITEEGLDEESAARKKEQEQEAKIKRQGQGARRVTSSRTPRTSARNTNQHGTSVGKRKSSTEYTHLVRDNLLVEKYDDMKLYAHTQNTRDWLKLVSHTYFAEMKKDLFTGTRRAFIQGYSSVIDNSERLGMASAQRHVLLETRATRYIEKLRSNLINALDRHRVDDLSPTDRINTVNSIFDSLRYRIDFIWDVEIRKARNLGFLHANRDLGKKSFRLVGSDTGCDRCLSTRTYFLAELAIDDLAPRHAGCRCRIELLEDK